MANKQPLKVIVVDDNKDVLELVAAVFECIGYKAINASGGNEKLLSVLEDQFGIVFTD